MRLAESLGGHQTSPAGVDRESAVGLRQSAVMGYLSRAGGPRSSGSPTRLFSCRAQASMTQESIRSIKMQAWRSRSEVVRPAQPESIGSRRSGCASPL